MHTNVIIRCNLRDAVTREDLVCRAISAKNGVIELIANREDILKGRKNSLAKEQKNKEILIRTMPEDAPTVKEQNKRIEEMKDMVKVQKSLIRGLEKDFDLLNDLESRFSQKDSKCLEIWVRMSIEFKRKYFSDFIDYSLK